MGARRRGAALAAGVVAALGAGFWLLAAPEPKAPSPPPVAARPPAPAPLAPVEETALGASSPPLMVPPPSQAELEDAARLAEPSRFEKVERAPSAHERAAAAHREARRLLRAGQLAAAGAAFERALDLDAKRHAARADLAAVLLASGRTEEAAALVEEGLALDPRRGSLVRLAARARLAKGDERGALAILEGAEPSLLEDPETLALVAALAQRVGQHARAASAYRQVLRVQPRFARYWLGLAISLEASGAHDEALERYRTALSVGGLAAEPRRFAEARVRALGTGE